MLHNLKVGHLNKHVYIGLIFSFLNLTLHKRCLKQYVQKIYENRISLIKYTSAALQVIAN